ncbi:MAG: EamA family transporter [Tindallia sp. MSAO_Bac2]|nr:MAG: EamA family transporter [Tindallia sp. MSAO_Bac2]
MLYILIAAILWGTTGTVQTVAPDAATPLTIGAVRMVGGGASLFLLALIRRKLHIRHMPIKYTMISAVSISIFQPVFFSSVAITGVAVGTVVALGSAPVMAGLMEWILWKRAPVREWWISTFMAITGCLMLFFANDAEISVEPIGILLALVAGFGFSIYIIFSKELLLYNDSETVVAVIFSISGLLLLPLLLFGDASWILEPKGFGISIYLGVIATAGAYLFFASGLKLTTASTAVTVTLAEPMTAALLGVFFVGETLTLIAWAGIGLIILGLASLSFTNKMNHKMKEGV